MTGEGSADVAVWPRYSGPEDIVAIEAVPLEQRGLPESTYAALRRAATLWPDQPAIAVIPDGTRWAAPVERTYGRLLADVHRTANALLHHGVRRSTPVALLSPNCDGLITATLAAQAAGIAAPVNPGLAADDIAHLLSLSGARHLIAAGPDLDETTWRTACRLRDAGVIDTLLLLEPTGAPHPGAADHLRIVAAQHDSTELAGQPPTPTDLAALFHTGGTTGKPKLAAHTHANEIADAWMIAANSDMPEGSVFLAALPLFHVNALVVTLLAPLLKRQRAVWAGPLGYRDPHLIANFWRIVERYGINAMSAVPTVYGALARTTVDADISSLRLGLVGASVLPEAVRQSFQDTTGVTLLEGYGLTEATCASARSFPNAPRAGSVGQRMPYQKVKAVSIGAGVWEDLPPGTVGNLAINGPTVFAGYVTGREGDAFILDGRGTLNDGWLDTGDLASVDADGFIFLTGRAKDLIIRGGHNIDPSVIEDALLSHPDVVTAAAVGRPDPHAGEVPVGYVTLLDGATATEEHLLDWAGRHVGEKAAAPKSVTVVDALPLTAVGKPNKLPLRAAAARTAIADALHGLPGVREVTAGNDDGATIVTVTLGPDADPTAVEAELTRYPVICEIRGEGVER